MYEQQLHRCILALDLSPCTSLLFLFFLIQIKHFFIFQKWLQRSGEKRENETLHSKRSSRRNAVTANDSEAR